MVICLERGADLHMFQLMPLPLTVSCFSKIQIGFSFLVPAHLGSPGERAVKRVCVCVCLFIHSLKLYILLHFHHREAKSCFLLLHSAPFTVNLISLKKEQRTIKHILWCMWETMSCYTLEEIYVKNKYQIFVVVVVLSTSLTLLQLHAI